MTVLQKIPHPNGFCNPVQIHGNKINEMKTEYSISTDISDVP
jgi:hypothetical protein